MALVVTPVIPPTVPPPMITGRITVDSSGAVWMIGPAATGHSLVIEQVGQIGGGEWPPKEPEPEPEP